MNRSSRLFLALALIAGPAAGADAVLAERVAGAGRVARPIAAEPPKDGEAGAKDGQAKEAEQEEAEKKNLPDENFLVGQRAQRDSARHMTSSAVDAGEAAISDLVQLRMEGNVLELDAGADNGVRSQRFQLKDANAFVTITRTASRVAAIGNGVLRPPSTSISMSRVDLDVQDDDAIWSASLSRSSTYLSMSGQSVLGRISFSQNMSSLARVGVRPAPPIRLTVFQWQAGPRQRSVFSATSESIDQLRSQHPEEFRKYLVPLFRKFSDMNWMIPGATDAYSVFGEIRPDDDAVAKLSALLPELDSDAFTVREAAAHQLMELGPAGVLAALRMDPASLSDEQKGQLGRLIAAHRRRDIVNSLEARKDPGFLTDCLEHPDQAVREAASASLEELLGKEVAFDPALSGDALTAAADEVRKLVRELMPATQPAGDDAVEPAPPAPIPQIQGRPLIR